MGATLVRTSLFLDDYREVALRIGEANPDAGERFCDAVEAALQLLSQNPQMGRLAGFASRPRVRRWVLQSFPNYVIYYEDRPAEVLLIRLLHGARNAPPLLQH